MSNESEKKKGDWQKPLLPVSVVALVAGLCAWWFTRTPDRIPEPVVEKPAPAEVEQRQVVPPPAAPKPVASTLLYAEAPDDGLPIHPVGSAPVPEGVMMHPHPITPQHKRIFRENALIGQLNGAMDVKDAKGMRQLLATYREEYPEDEMVMQEGYQLVIDCLESPGEATRAAAKKYYDTEIASGLRRYIRRHCLEN